MHPAPITLSPGGILRPLLEEDVTESYVDGLNDPEVNRFLVGPRSSRQTIESVQAFVRLNRLDQNGILFGLFVEDRLRGTARLHDISSEGAFLGIAIFDRDIWGKGWGGRMISAITSFALNSLQIPRVQAVIEGENEASRRTFAKVGYVHVLELDRHEDGVNKELWDYRPHDTQP